MHLGIEECSGGRSGVESGKTFLRLFMLIGLSHMPNTAYLFVCQICAIRYEACVCNATSPWFPEIHILFLGIGSYRPMTPLSDQRRGGSSY